MGAIGTYLLLHNTYALLYDRAPGFQAGDVACRARKNYQRMLFVFKRSVEFTDEWSVEQVGYFLYIIPILFGTYLFMLLGI